MFCGEQSIVTSSHFGQIACPVKCKRWGCPNCQEWRQNCLMARCIEGKPNRFITFTCRAGQHPSKAAQAKAMSQAWRTVVQRWRRLKPYHKCEYICVFEPHVSGWPHMHVLWKGHWIAQKWLSKQGKELLNSPVQHVSLIKNAKQAAFYVAKYFSKEPEKFGTAKRYWTSKNWPKLKHINPEGAFHKGFPIELVNKTISSIVETWRRYAKEVYEIPPNLYAWGSLTNFHSEPHKPRPPPWNDVFGFQVSRTGCRRSPMASEGGQRA